MGIKKQLDEKDISLVAMGSGTPDQANVFVKKYGFTGEMFVSPDLSAYRAFKLFRGLWRSVGPASVYRGIKAITKGFRQGYTAGDPWQQGGVFLIGPGARLLFEHKDQFAGDHADLNEVLAAAELSAAAEKSMDK